MQTQVDEGAGDDADLLEVVLVRPRLPAAVALRLQRNRLRKYLFKGFWYFGLDLVFSRPGRPLRCL